MATVNASAPLFRVGDAVSFVHGVRRVWAQIIEDRGDLGINGRRLYRVRVEREATEPRDFEMPEDDLSPAPNKAAAIQFLADGGLISILKRNLGGGRNQPRVWLTTRSAGTVTYTLAGDAAMVGGATVPFGALEGERIFTPVKHEVVTFLTSFGLTRAEAEHVVSAVGTAP